jgi:hypothetical protein
MKGGIRLKTIAGSKALPWPMILNPSKIAVQSLNGA